ncbi:MAG: hypothetical protein AMXMBFR61_15290 [Fimbriimonadales bacterium]
MRAFGILVLWLCSAAVLAQIAVAPSPLRLADRTGPDWGTALAFDPLAYRALKTANGRVLLRGFPLDAGRKVNLELQRFEVFSAHTQLVVVYPDGERRLPFPDVVLLRGKVQDEPDSEVYLGLSPHLSNGWINRGDERHMISTRDGITTITDLRTLPTQPASNWTCEALIPPYTDSHADNEVRIESVGPRIASIAVETDREFTLLRFSNNPTRAAEYVAELYGAMTFIYERDVQTRLVVTYLRLWMTNDPWDKASSGDQLSQYRDYWVNNMAHIPRALGHFLSARNLGGGVAWVGVVCNPWWGFGLSGNINGYFNPSLEPHWSNWDIFVVAHETGHNFGTLHTHDGYNPPIDTCGLGCNDPPFVGTIMSYCHTCPGGMWNILLQFHPRVIERILYYLQYEAGCNLTRARVTGTVDLQYYLGDPVGFMGGLELRNPGTRTIRYLDYPALDANRRFTSSWLADCGDYDAWLYWETYLGKTVPNIVVAAPSIDLSVLLTAGDADYTNVVDIADLTLVLASLGTGPGQGDLNWDGAVDLSDLNIVLINFGKQGDN